MDMDRPEPSQPEFHAGNDLGFVSETGGIRAKSSLRIRYESEARVILQSLGGLEGIRQRLGLTQRKLAQLLLVDPSAWSRWLKDESRVPPHVVKALQWYLQLEDKDPAWQQWREFILKRERDPGGLDRWRRDLEARLKTRTPVSAESPDFKSQFDELKETDTRLAGELDRRVVLGLGWKLLLLLNSLAVMYWIAKAIF
jgi:transcriptional regulator with XRE-family HTH domain